jgi:retinol dehydrogenase 13
MKVPEELQFMVNARMPQKATTTRLDGKTAVITGATSGVGFYAAQRMAEGGADLVLVCRNPEKALKIRLEFQNKHGIKVDLIKADFSKLAEVREASFQILNDHPHIDVLINNIGVHRTKRTLTEEGFETAFCVNHLSSFLLTRLLLDRMISSAPSRIIQVNSQGHRFGGLDINDLDWKKRRYKGLQGYGASKVAQLMTVWELSDYLLDKGVTVNAVHPGGVRTNIGMDNDFLFRWYQRILIWPFLKDPKVSGEYIYYFAASPEMEGVSGKFFNQTIEEKPAAHALDKDLGKRIFRKSEELTQLPQLR